MEASAPPAPGETSAYGRADLDGLAQAAAAWHVEALARGYVENDILTYASAISFQVFFALIPLGLFALGGTGISNR